MEAWTGSGRSTDNDCPCEPLSQHPRLCDVSGPCVTCADIADCPYACTACRGQRAMLRLLAGRSTGGTVRILVEPQHNAPKGHFDLMVGG